MLFRCKLAECEYATAERVAMVRGDNEIERHCQSAIGTHVQVELMNMWMLISQRHINSGSKLLNTERRWRNGCEPARLLVPAPVLVDLGGNKRSHKCGSQPSQLQASRRTQSHHPSIIHLFEENLVFHCMACQS